MKDIRTPAQLLFRIFVRPVFPLGQWLARVTGVAKEAKTVEGPYRRQPFLVGKLRTGIHASEVRARLIAAGFFMNPIAYPDPGQTLSMRRLDDANPDRQYHLRTFEDGEVRGHYEYTPEDHPIAHMDETLFTPAQDIFTAALGDLLGQAAREKGSIVL